VEALGSDFPYHTMSFSGVKFADNVYLFNPNIENFKIISMMTNDVAGGVNELGMGD